MSVWDQMDAAQVAREVAWAAALERGVQALREVNARRSDDWMMAGEGYQSERGRKLHGAEHEAEVDAAMAASLARLEASGIHTGRRV